MTVLNRCLYKTEDRRSLRSFTNNVANIRGDEINIVKEYLDMARSWVALFVQSTISYFSDSPESQKVVLRNDNLTLEPLGAQIWMTVTIILHFQTYSLISHSNLKYAIIVITKHY